MTTAQGQPTGAKGPPPSPAIALWAVAAAFGTYFCMYVFRKPFTAASYAGGEVFGLPEKTVLVTTQVFGYMLSKVVGIRVIAELPPARRALGLLVLVGAAELALLGFAVMPSPMHAACLFVNGLALGMVFGLVLGFLEGRRTTEALAAGLCASFILADGVAKSVGTWLLDQGVSERMMPGLADLLFVPPILLFVGMLSRVPPPDKEDVIHRGERSAMDRHDRAAMIRGHGLGLMLLIGVYLLVTIARSVRADFMPEIWRGLGVEAAPETFARSEVLVAFFVLASNGLSVLIRDNRRAFFAAIGVAMVGGLMMLAALAGLRRGSLDGLTFMVLVGIGLYLPYVVIHTTIFERLIAMTRDRGNLGFLMYLADAVGYLGYVVLMLTQGLIPTGPSFLTFFSVICGVIAVLTCLSLAASWVYYARRTSALKPPVAEV
ncbi:DUF5690 family protein [Tautonia sociabilis]|uniref:MFS transporter n=1 Tax=Tautonia sociabilis TaxID=2080755 RepID=A0A432MP05_9BACT|nr:DUF5690 family protein [Tautonia sociabilis]RUL89183.1 hypothetical protein TsocGM_03445 [Tautonia sociabilis]